MISSNTVHMVCEILKIIGHTAVSFWYEDSNSVTDGVRIIFGKGTLLTVQLSK